MSYNLLNTVLKVKNRMVVNVSVVYPHDHMAAWELQLVATIQHCDREVHAHS